ncbi:hypothetical protein CEXT_158131 [Caerostris extrusa]|uniref:Uncharacterized protein n=1 Tax=Caerostris extrusa TaxID=172846 RepID=A0AAV4XCH7_CAEEX|nr:hypothetical protein CEXT_158131 [Caerostris extrusa]
MPVDLAERVQSALDELPTFAKANHQFILVAVSPTRACYLCSPQHQMTIPPKVMLHLRTSPLTFTIIKSKLFSNWGLVPHFENG